jgi:CRISPR/Cas system-associated protein Cas10 (large subunit of type III CRISPR-Cas system)
MSTLDRVKILKESINDKINQSRNDMHESHNPVYNDKIWIEIETVEWVLGRINQLEDKKRQIYLIIQSIYSVDSRVQRTHLEIYPRPKYLIQNMI